MASFVIVSGLFFPDVASMNTGVGALGVNAPAISGLGRTAHSPPLLAGITEKFPRADNVYLTRSFLNHPSVRGLPGAKEVALPDLKRGAAPPSSWQSRLRQRMEALGQRMLSQQGVASRLARLRAGPDGGFASGLQQDIQKMMVRSMIDSGINELHAYKSDAIKNLELSYRTAIGNQPAMVGVEMLFSLLDEGDRTVFGQTGLTWDEDDDTSLNMGLGYRHLIAEEEALLGVNVFYDYQSEMNLQRYSLGLELKSRVMDLYANWYDGIGSENLPDGRTVYTPDGFDVEALGRLPLLPWVEFSGKYYSWNLRDGAEDQRGQKYAVRAKPVPLFILEGQYDRPEAGEEDWGVEAKLDYRFGVSMGDQLKPGRVQAEAPRHRRFEQVRREYRQRAVEAGSQQTMVTLSRATVNGVAYFPPFEIRRLENTPDPLVVAIQARRDGDFFQARDMRLTLMLSGTAVRGSDSGSGDYFRVADGTTSCSGSPDIVDSDDASLDFPAASATDTDPAATGGVATAQFTLCLRDNSDVDRARAIHIDAVVPEGYQFDAASRVTLHIDDDETPLVVFASAASTVAENGSASTVRLNISPAPAETLAVSVTVSGTATVTSDYTLGVLSGTHPNYTLAVSAGATTASLTVTPRQDSALEGTETVILTLAPAAAGGNYTLGAVRVHTVSLTDVMPSVPAASITPATATAAEDAGTVTAAVTVSPAPAATLNVMVTVSGSAVRGTDYSLSVGAAPVTADTFTVPVSTSGLATISIALTDDSVAEGTEEVVLTIQSASGYTVGSPSSHRLSVTDDDSATVPLVTFQSGSSMVSEDMSANITLTIAQPPVSASAFDVAVTGRAGAGLQSSEYILPPIVQVGSGAATATLRVVLTDDTADEDDETLTITLTPVASGAAYGVGTQNTHTLTIVDNDAPQVEFASAASTVAENAGSAHTVTLNISPATVASLTVPVTVSGTATVTSDYTPGAALSGTHPNYTLTVAAGAATAPLTLTPVNDSGLEGTETVILMLGTGTGYSLGARRMHTIALTDDETDMQPPVADFTAATATAAEDGGTVTAMVAVAPAPAAGMTVNVMVMAETGAGIATRGTDYSLSVGAAAVTDDTFTVPVGDSGTAAISIALTDDSVVEGTEVVMLTIQPAATYTVGSPLSHRLSVTDNDVPAVTFRDATSSVRESATTTIITLTVTPISTVAFSVPLTGTPGTGLVENTEYILPSTVPVSRGQMEVTFSVTLIDDMENEVDETLMITLTDGTDYDIGTQGTHTLTITDDDAPQVVFASTGSSVAEDAGSAHTVTLNIDPAPVASLTVPVTVTGTATVTSDYTLGTTGVTGAHPNYMLTVAASDTTASLTLTPVDDADLEGAETVILTLGARTTGGQYELGPVSVHTVSLADDEVGATRRVADFTAATATAAEDGGTVTATVEVTPAPAAGTTLDVMVMVSGSAVRGTDYTLSVGTTAVMDDTFPVEVGTGGTAAIRIALTDDSTAEGTEEVVLTIQSSADYALGAPLSHRLSVTDNDVPTVAFRDATSSESEDATVANITLTVTPAAPDDFDVSLTGAAGTGLQGTEYTLPATVSVSRGDTMATLRVTLTDDDVNEDDETLTITLTAGTDYAVGTQNTHALTITDDDTPQVVFASASSTVAEDAGSAHTVTLNIDPASAASLTVPVTVTGTATVTSDYTLSGVTSGMLTVAANATTASLTVTPVNDTDVEGTETVILTLGARTTGGQYELGPASVHTVALTDDEASTLPVADFTAATATAAEDAGTVTATVEVAVTPAPAAAMTVNVMVTASGSAVRGTDYTLSLGAAAQTTDTFAVPVTVDTGGSGTAAISIALTDDSAAEGTEEVVLTIQSATAYTLGAPLSHRLSVTDDDAPTVAFRDATSSESEDATVANITLTVTPAAPDDFDVSLTGVAGTGLQGTEYTLPATVSVSRGDTMATLRVTLTDDDVNEDDETLTITLTDGTDYDVGTQNTHALTITDDDTPEVVFASASSTLAEDAGSAHTVTLNIDPAPAASLTVPVTVAGTATLTSDYTLSGVTSGMLTVAANATTASLTVTPVDDDDVESAETVILTLGTGTGYSVGAPRVHTVTLTSEDTPPPVADFTAATATAAEDAGTVTATVEVAVTPAPAAAMTVNVMVTASGSAVRGTDYALSLGAVAVTTDTFTVPVTVDTGGSGTAAISIVLTDDTAVEGTEEVALTIQSATGYTVGAPPSHRLSVTDDDVPVVAFQSASSSASEQQNDMVADVILVITPAAIAPLVVSLTGTPGTGLGENTEYRLPATVNVSRGATTATLRVSLIDDSVNEVDETLTITLTDGADYDVGTPGTHVLTLTDDDVPEAVFANASSTLAEDAGSAHTVTLNIDPVPAVNLTVPVTVSGTATLTSDYTLGGTGVTGAHPNYMLAVAASDATASLTVTPVDDTDVEETETVILTLGTGTGYSVGAPGVHTVMLTSEDTPPPVADFTAATATAAEDDGTVTATVAVTPAPAATVNVMVTASGSAVRGTDYTLSLGAVAVTTDTFTVPVGTGGTAAVSIMLTDDTAVEGTEEVVLTIQSAAGYTVGAPLSHRLSVTDDDVPVVAFQSATSSVRENASVADITLTVTPAATVPFAVSLTGVAGTGLQGSEYTLPATVSVSRGATTARLRVTLNDDNSNESNETLTITLTDGADYDVGTPGTHTLTINDDDTQVMFMSAASTRAENVTPANVPVQVTISPVSTRSLTIPVSLGGTARTLVDYSLGGVAGSGNNRSLTVPANTGSVTITVTITNDDTFEPDETVILTLGTGTGYAVGARNRHTLTITNDDAMPVAPTAFFATSTGTVGEDVGTTRITVSLDRAAPAGGLAVRYRLHPVQSTVQAGDYTLAGLDASGFGTVRIAAGQSQADIVVTIIDDTAQENAEVMRFLLPAPAVGANYLVDGARNTHALTIRANDAPTVTPLLNIDSTASTLTAVEGGTAASVVVTLSAAPAATVNVVMRVSGGSAADDYTLTPANGTLVFNTTTLSATLTITARNDTDTTNETITVQLPSAAPAGTTLGTSTSVSVTILDDDGAPTLNIVPSASTLSAFEGGTSARVIVDMLPAPTSPISVTMRVTGGDAGDYILNPSGGTLTFNATTSRQTLTIAAAEDTDTASERLTVQLPAAAPAGAALGSVDEVTVTLIDNDSTVVSLEFALAGASVVEGDVIENFISFSANTDETLTVNLLVENVAGPGGIVAASGSDYSFLDLQTAPPGASGYTHTLGFPPGGNTAGGLRFRTQATYDTTVESTERFRVTLVAGTGYTLGAQTSTAVDIVSLRPIVGFGRAAQRVAETASANARTIQVPLNISGSLPVPMTIEVVSASTTAEAADYTLSAVSRRIANDVVSYVNEPHTVSGGRLSIPAATHLATNVQIVVNADSGDTADEILALRIVPSNAYVIGAAAFRTPLGLKGGFTRVDVYSPTYYLYITDTGSDTPTVSFTRQENVMVEGEARTASTSVEVLLSRPAAAAITVNIGLSGTATPHDDYTFTGRTLNAASTSTTLTIPRNASSGSLVLRINSNDGWENDEIITLTLTSGTGYTVCTGCVSVQNHRIRNTGTDDTGYRITLGLAPGTGVTPGSNVGGGSGHTLGTVDEATAGQVRLRFRSLNAAGTQPRILPIDLPLSVSTVNYTRAGQSVFAGTDGSPGTVVSAPSEHASAARFEDYGELGATRWAAGTSQFDVTLPIIDDSEVEHVESIIMLIWPPGDRRTGDSGETIFWRAVNNAESKVQWMVPLYSYIHIRNDDVPVANFRTTEVSLSEGSPAQVFSVTTFQIDFDPPFPHPLPPWPLRIRAAATLNGTPLSASVLTAARGIFQNYTSGLEQELSGLNSRVSRFGFEDEAGIFSYEDTHVGNLVATVEILAPSTAPGSVCADDPTRCYRVGPNNLFTVNVIDNDRPFVGFSRVAATVGEAATDYMVEVYIESPAALTSNIVFSYTLDTDGTTATQNSDFRLASTTQVTIPSTTTLTDGRAVVQFPLTILNDNATEEDETVVLQLASGTTYNIEPTASSFTLTIADDEGAVPPTVSFAAAESTTDEGSTTSIIVSGDRPLLTSATLSIPIALDAAATTAAAGDYSLTAGGSALVLPGTLTIARNQSTATVDLAYTDDNAFKGDRQVVLVIGPTITGGTLGTPSRHVARLLEDEMITLNFSRAAQTVAEDVGTHQVNVSLSGAPATPVTLNYRVEGSARSTRDYSALSGSFTVAANTSSSSIAVTVIDDVDQEEDETLILTLVSDSTAVSVGTTSMYTLTITDNDEVGMEFASTSISVLEGDVIENFIAFSPDTQQELTVRLSVNTSPSCLAGETAAAASDYDFLDLQTAPPGASGYTYTLGFPPGGNTASGLRFRIRATYDTTAEPTERFCVTLVDGPGYTLGTQASIAVDIVNARPIVGFGRAAQRVAETASAGARTIRVPLNISGSLPVPMTIEVVSASTTAEAADYTLSAVSRRTANNGTVSYVNEPHTVSGGRLSITGATHLTTNVQIVVNADSGDTADEILALRIVPSNAYVIGAAAFRTPLGIQGGFTRVDVYSPTYYLHITDSASGVTPTVSFTRQENVMIEGEARTASTSVEVLLSRPATAETTVNIGLSGTATPHDDYTFAGRTLTASSTATTLTIANGASSGNLVMSINSNDGWENDEMITLTLTSGTGYTVCCVSVQNHRIRNTGTDDTGYRITLGLAPGTGVTPGNNVGGGSGHTLGTVEEATAGQVRLRFRSLDAAGMQPRPLPIDLPLPVSTVNYTRAGQSVFAGTDGSPGTIVSSPSEHASATRFEDYGELSATRWPTGAAQFDVTLPIINDSKVERVESIIMLIWPPGDTRTGDSGETIFWQAINNAESKVQWMVPLYSYIFIRNDDVPVANFRTTEAAVSEGSTETTPAGTTVPTSVPIQVDFDQPFLQAQPPWPLRLRLNATRRGVPLPSTDLLAARGIFLAFRSDPMRPDNAPTTVTDDGIEVEIDHAGSAVTRFGLDFRSGLFVFSDDLPGDVIATVEILPPSTSTGTSCGDDPTRCYEVGTNNIFTVTIRNTDL